MSAVLGKPEAGRPSRGLYLPIHIDKVRFYRRPGATLYSHARLTERSPTAIKGDIRLLGEDGLLLAEVQGFLCRAIEQSSETVDNFLYEHRWLLKWGMRQAGSGRAADHLLTSQQIAQRLQPDADRWDWNSVQTAS